MGTLITGIVCWVSLAGFKQGGKDIVHNVTWGVTNISRLLKYPLVVYLVSCLSPGLALKKLTTYTAFEMWGPSFSSNVCVRVSQNVHIVLNSQTIVQLILTLCISIVCVMLLWYDILDSNPWWLSLEFSAHSLHEQMCYLISTEVGWKWRWTRQMKHRHARLTLKSW